MKLKDYIAMVLSIAPEGDIQFEINLGADGYVYTNETGNKITFITYNEKKEEVKK